VIQGGQHPHGSKRWTNAAVEEAAEDRLRLYLDLRQVQVATNGCLGSTLVAMQVATVGDATKISPRRAATNLVPDVVALLAIAKRAHAPSVQAEDQEGVHLVWSHI